jgi:PqqD family protein of HPr-rel-A system
MPGNSTTGTPQDLSFDEKQSGFFWRCDCFAELLQCSLDEDVFIFNPLTGHTHILNQLSWQLLLACAEVPRSDAHLFQLMATESDGMDKQQLEDSVQGHLGQLQQLDLLHARSCS